MNKEMIDIVNSISNKVAKDLLNEIDLTTLRTDGSFQTNVDLNSPQEKLSNKETNLNNNSNITLFNKNEDSDQEDTPEEIEYINYFDSQVNIKHKKEWQKQQKFIEILDSYLVGDINLNDTIANTILNLEGDTFIRDKNIEKLEFFIKEIVNKWELFDMSKYRNIDNE